VPHAGQGGRGIVRQRDVVRRLARGFDAAGASSVACRLSRSTGDDKVRSRNRSNAMPALRILHIIARLPVIGASRDQGSTLHRCSGAMFQVTMRERRVHAHPPRVGRPDWIILA
jgi:hypothetical protein